MSREGKLTHYKVVHFAGRDCCLGMTRLPYRWPGDLCLEDQNKAIAIVTLLPTQRAPINPSRQSSADRPGVRRRFELIDDMTIAIDPARTCKLE